MDAVPLNTLQLGRLPSNVRVPKYDRRALTSGILHIGVGGFHRAHQALYLDELLHRPGSEAFGICGVGLLPHDVRMRDVLRNQDYLYTLVTRGADVEEARVIGSIIDFAFGPDDPNALVERMAADTTKIVSLTITEAGYCVDQTTRELDRRHPSIEYDLKNPSRPIGTFGYLAEALHRRKERGKQPFTIMSCDNLQNNGDVCCKTMLAFLQLRDADLAAWVEQHGAFPNSMVDRITPATTDEHRALVRDRFGIVDGWPVTAEPFLQWVIEDHFVQGRPAWETVGAQVVTDIEPYEKMKIRLLNGSHQVLCYIGLLLGYRYAPQAMADGSIRELLRLFMDREVTPLLPPVPGVDLNDYKQTLRQRFANPAINDQLLRIATDGSARVGEFVLPTIREELRRGGPIAIGTFAVAAWMRHLTGRDAEGQEFTITDPLADRLRQEAAAGGKDPSRLLDVREVFDPELLAADRFRLALSETLERLYDQGPRAALDRCLGQAEEGL